MILYITPAQVRAARAADPGRVPIEQILAAADLKRQRMLNLRRAIAADAARTATLNRRICL